MKATPRTLSAEVRERIIPIGGPAILVNIHGYSMGHKLVWTAFELDKEPGDIFAYFLCDGSTDMHTEGVSLDNELDGLKGVYAYLVAFDEEQVKKVCKGTGADLIYGASAVMSGYPNHRTLEYRTDGTVWYTWYGPDGKTETHQIDKR